MISLKDILQSQFIATSAGRTGPFLLFLSSPSAPSFGNRAFAAELSVLCAVRLWLKDVDGWLGPDPSGLVSGGMSNPHATLDPPI